MKTDLRAIIVQKLDEYLSGKITANEVSSWAEQVVISKEFRSLSEEEVEAIHALFDLHDQKGTWVPTPMDLRHYRDLLVRAP
jgi:hypothetical protein